jgi:hypothetical protein
MKDGIAALWYIIRYNWLTSREASYRHIPMLEPGRVDNPPQVSNLPHKV